MKVIEHPKVRSLLTEFKAMKARWHETHRQGDRRPFARMQEMKSEEFARVRAAELSDLRAGRE